MPKYLHSDKIFQPFLANWFLRWIQLIGRFHSLRLWAWRLLFIRKLLSKLSDNSGLREKIHRFNIWFQPFEVKALEHPVQHYEQFQRVSFVGRKYRLIVADTSVSNSRSSWPGIKSIVLLPYIFCFDYLNFLNMHQRLVIAAFTFLLFVFFLNSIAHFTLTSFPSLRSYVL